MAIRSYLDTIACLDMVESLPFFPSEDFKPIRDQGHQLFNKLQAFRKILKQMENSEKSADVRQATGKEDRSRETVDRSSISRRPPSVSINSPLTRESAYRSLCYVLSERAGQVAWETFTPIDWELFARMAKAEGVAPLMYWKLKDTSINVPPETFDFLRSTYYQTLAHNTLLFQELERILGALEAAGIPVIVLKGAALAGTLYEDIGLRPMSDLDLLVRPEDLRGAIRAVRTIGYQLEKITYHVVFRGGVNNTTKIELHWNIPTQAGTYSENIAWFWENTNPISRNRMIKGFYPQALIFYPPSQLLHLVLHAIVQHQGQELLLRYLDIYLLLIKWSDTFDAKEIHQWAIKFGLENALEKAINIVEEKYLITELNNKFAKNIIQQNIYDSPIMGDNMILYKDSIVAANSLLNWQTRVLAYYMLLVPNQDYMMRRYHPNPNWLWPLYYPFRWFSIAQVIFRSLLNRNSVNLPL